MERFKIRVQPLLLIYIFLCIYFNWFNDIFYYVIAVTLHEYGHYIVAKKLGYSVEGMVFAVYGTSLKTSNIYKPKDEVVISLAGPMVNIILVLLCVAMWWIVPTSYLFTERFVFCNIIVLVFNILPIYPLDGGRVILSVLSTKISRTKLEKMSSRICLILGICLIFLFLVSIYYAINYNLLITGFFLTLNSTVNSANYYKNAIKIMDKKYKKPVEVKVFKVEGLSRSQLVKYLSPHYYSVFEVKVKDGEHRVEEKDLLI